MQQVSDLLLEKHVRQSAKVHTQRWIRNVDVKTLRDKLPSQRTHLHANEQPEQLVGVSPPRLTTASAC